MTFLVLQGSSKSDVVTELDKAVMSVPRLGHPDWATALGPLCSFRLLDCRVGWSGRELLVVGQHQLSAQVKVCGICTSREHPTNMCPTLQETGSDNAEIVRSIGGYQYG
ncbi:hypothetical protein CR513_01065, partial [Mucuna pruriens]